MLRWKFEQPHEIHVGKNRVILRRVKLSWDPIVISLKGILEDARRHPLISVTSGITSLAQESTVMTCSRSCPKMEYAGYDFVWDSVHVQALMHIIETRHVDHALQQ